MTTDLLQTKLTAIMTSLGWDGKLPENWATHEDKLGYLLGKIEELLVESSGKAGIKFTIVDTLPATGEDNCFYLVPAKNEADQDIYEEYLWLESKFEKLGSTDIKIENYYTKNEISEIVEKVTSEVSAEATSRVTADDGLQAKIEQEITDRATNDQDIIDGLNIFKTEATNSFTDVNSAISFEVNDREAGISDLESKLATKQDVLVSGTTVKTINGESILGTGDIDTAKDMVAVIIRRY